MLAEMLVGSNIYVIFFISDPLSTILDLYLASFASKWGWLDCKWGRVIDVDFRTSFYTWKLIYLDFFIRLGVDHDCDR